MKKSDVLAALPALETEWRRTLDMPNGSADQLDGAIFVHWLEFHYPEYLKFRSVQPPADVIEMWFARETHQMWKY